MPFEILEERLGSELVGWRYEGPFDELEAVRKAFAGGTRDTPDRPYEHVVVAWDEVGEAEGTGIVHIAPGCGAEDYQLGKSLGLPVIAPLDESGVILPGFGSLTGRDVRDVAEPIVEHLKHEGRFQRLETITHRYPHCWRCGTALVFRLVDEWYVSMGPLYDQPRESLTAEQVDASLRYQIMDVVDQIRWIPDFGLRAGARLAPQHARLDDQQEALLGPGAADLRLRRVRDGLGGGRSRGPAGARRRPAGRPSRATRRIGRTWTPSGSPAMAAEPRSSGSRTSGTRGWTPASCRSRRSTSARSPTYWADWFPADFITESFPGQFRNWFYSMLAMSTVLRREPPFKTIFGYALVFGEDGRPMHKSWGNAIDFDEAAERMGVDVMRWMFAKARPEDNILFGWHAADEARRELLVLWNVYAFFATYARLAGWTPDQAGTPDRAGTPDVGRPSWTAGSCPGPRARQRSSRIACATSMRSAPPGRSSDFMDGLSTWYLRLSRRRFSRSDDPADRAAAFATLHEALVATTRMLAPILPVRDRRDVPEPRRRRGRDGSGQRPPDPHSRPPTWPRTGIRAWRRRWPSSSGPSTWPGRCAAPRGSRPASRWRRPGSRCRIAASRSDDRAAAPSWPTRST